MGRHTVGKDYTKREKELLECIAPKRWYLNPNDEATASKKQKNISERQRRKREKKNQKDRHQAEHEWKNEYHADLDLQLWFNYIEYIDVDTANILNPLSEQQIEEEEQEMREKRKEAMLTDFNFDYFLMYTSETSTSIVIEEEWFQDTNKETGENIQLLSMNTLEKCKQTLNKQRLLSKTDLWKIKRYVNSIKVGNSSVIIRQVKKNQKIKMKKLSTSNVTYLHPSTHSLVMLKKEITTSYRKIG